MSFQKSTRVLKQEVLDICGELTDGSSPFDAKAVAYLDKVYQGIIAGNNLFETSCSEPWVWAQSKKPILLSLNPVFDGACTLTNGSTDGTFSSAPTISLAGRYIAAEGDFDYYRIASHTAASTSFSIDQNYLGNSGTYNYSAYKYDYEAFDDVIIISNKNNKIDFSEGGLPLVATLTSGSYSPTTLCTEIVTRMNAAGAQTYTATFNSITRKFTIVQGGTTFSLLFGSGASAYVSASGVLGYDVEDLTEASTYTSTYALSGIVRMSKPITIYSNSSMYTAAEDSNKIFMVDDNTFLRDYPINRLISAYPDKFCPVEINPDGLWTLRFNASVQNDTRVEVNYIGVARALKDNVNSYPLIPGNFSDLLVYGAAHFLQVDKSDSKAADSATKAVAELKALVAFNRQGSGVAGNNFGKIVPRPNQIRRFVTKGSAY